MSVMTDRQSQALITGAYAYVQANPTVTVSSKTASGFVSLTAAEVTAVANAVGANVQASFAAEDTGCPRHRGRHDQDCGSTISHMAWQAGVGINCFALI